MSNWSGAMRGKIVDEAAYLDGKRFDFSGHLEFNPRNSTPCNVDSSADNGVGDIMEMEVSRKTSNWDDYPDGQHRHMRAKVGAGRGSWIVVLIKVDTPDGDEANTVADVVEFSVLHYVDDPTYVGGVRRAPTQYGNALWREFLRRWWAGNAAGALDMVK